MKKIIEKNGMVWRIEKGEKIEWSGMRRMVFPNEGHQMKMKIIPYYQVPVYEKQLYDICL